MTSTSMLKRSVLKRSFNSTHKVSQIIPNIYTKFRSEEVSTIVAVVAAVVVIATLAITTTLIVNLAKSRSNSTAIIVAIAVTLTLTYHSFGRLRSLTVHVRLRKQ